MLTSAMTRRNVADTPVPIIPPISLKPSNLAFEHADGQRDEQRRRDHDGRMPQREKQADGNRTFGLLHELARDVVDSRDVVGIDGMAKPERIGERCGSQQQRIIAEAREGPGPRRDVDEDEQRAEHDGFRLASTGTSSQIRNSRPRRLPPVNEGRFIASGRLTTAWPCIGHSYGPAAATPRAPQCDR